MDNSLHRYYTHDLGYKLDHKQIGPFTETPISFHTGTGALFKKSVFEILFTHNALNHIMCHVLRCVFSASLISSLSDETLIEHNTECTQK